MKYLAFAAAAALSVSVSSVGHATTINVTNSSFALGSQDGTLHLTAGGPFNGATANFGQFKLDGFNVTAGNVAVTFFTYCVDLNQALVIPGTFTIQPLSTMFSNATTQLNLTKLLANVTPTNADQSAAVQLAIWELAVDSSASKDVQGGATQGQFWVTAGTSATARTLANGYLASLGGWSVPVGASAQLLYNQGNQSQIFLVSSVPESATWTMMITGFGIAGASLRLRRRQTAVAA